MAINIEATQSPPFDPTREIINTATLALEYARALMCAIQDAGGKEQADIGIGTIGESRERILELSAMGHREGE